MMEHPWVDLHMFQWMCAPGLAACAEVRLCVGVERGRKVALPRKPSQEEQEDASSASGVFLHPAHTCPVLL